jgi:acyl-CoA synthetase (AMP-forming)/AMP-acid ligase II
MRERHYGREILVYPDRPRRLEAILRETAGAFADKWAVAELGGRRYTYAELAERVEAGAAWLHRRGLRPGERVALLLGNNALFAVWTFAILRAGGIVLPVNLRLHAAEVGAILSDAAPSMVVGGEEASHLRSGLEGYRLVSAEEILAQKKASSLEELGSEDDPAFLIYTSGTTGKPKGVVLTHFNVIHSLFHYREVFGTSPDDRTLVAVPLFHVTGLIGQLLHMVLVGGSSVLLPRYQTDDFALALEQWEVTFTFAVPTIYAFLLAHGLAQRRLPSWRLAAYGGAPMPLAVLQALTAAFPSLDVRNAYGATETASPATLMPRGATALRPLSVGRPVPKGEIRIDDPDATGVGEVLIRGPMVTPGYFQRPEENARAFTEDGYWRSGDLGYLDEEGFLFVVDRLKEVINRGGEKIYSQEVENILYQHPGVLEAAVVGVPDPLYGERVKAVVVPRPGVSLVEDELRRFLSERLAAFKVPEIYEFRDSLPRNPGGKVLKSLLRQERQSG